MYLKKLTDETTFVLEVKMRVKEFSNYDKACEFRDKVGGQVEWSSYKGKPLWYVWYSESR